MFAQSFLKAFGKIVDLAYRLYRSDRFDHYIIEEKSEEIFMVSCKVFRFMNFANWACCSFGTLQNDIHPCLWVKSKEVEGFLTKIQFL